MSLHFYSIEKLDYLNKKGIIFNVLLIENGLNILNNVLATNSDSYEAIMGQFSKEAITTLTNIFEKIYVLWDLDDKNTNSKEIMNNKLVFEKYKEMPKNNMLIQILLVLDKLLDLREKLQFYNNNNYEDLFNYISDIDINMRIKLTKLNIKSDLVQNIPTLVIYTQSEQEIKEQIKSEFTFGIDGLTFYEFKNMIKEGYESDLDLFYTIEISDNNSITREIKTEKDFEVFMQEIMDIYTSQPNKDNIAVANLNVKLKPKKPKINRKCINCNKEIEVELDIDENKFKEMNNLSNIDNVNSLNKLLNESKTLCKECEKYILEHAKNQINIENSKNMISNLTGLNLSNLNISNVAEKNNIYQNILANDTLRNNIYNNSILSTSLFNRTMNTNNTLFGLNSNILNQNSSNLFGLSGINNISAISPITPRRENIIPSTIVGGSSINQNNSNFKILGTNSYQ